MNQHQQKIQILPKMKATIQTTQLMKNKMRIQKKMTQILKKMKAMRIRMQQKGNQMAPIQKKKILITKKRIPLKSTITKRPTCKFLVDNVLKLIHLVSFSMNILPRSVIKILFTRIVEKLLCGQVVKNSMKALCYKNVTGWHRRVKIAEKSLDIH